jgi:Methyltransferase small domain
VNFCQHFTADHCCDALIAEVGHPSPMAVMDVGAGLGGLSRAAIKRWGNVNLRQLDVDHEVLSHLRRHFPNAQHLNANLLSSNTPKELSNWIAHADIALCNPPFTTANDPSLEFWLEMADMPSDWPSQIKQRAEVIFLAHNLRWLKAEGELLLILPACFINGQVFTPFRQWLVSRMTVLKVARLPRNAFQSAEVKAFAVIAQNSPSSQPYPIELIDLVAASMPQRLVIDSLQAMQRMDIGFHALQRVAAPTRLGDLQPDLVRGAPVVNLRQSGSDFFHTTDFIKTSSLGYICLSSLHKSCSTPQLQAGDIVLGRVGRNCHLQAARVLRGQASFSDCVYRLRVAPELRAAVFASFQSEAGKAWRASRLRGSAVNLMSKADLLEHPIWWGE